MKNYELVAILGSEIKTEDQEKLVTRIKKIITDAGGKITVSDTWGKKDFAYLIKKTGSGDYFYFEFSSEPLAINSLKQKLQLEEKILRYLLTVVEEKKSKPEEKPKKEEIKPTQKPKKETVK